MRPFVLHLQSTIDKLSPYYVMRFNVSTINFGSCQHGFWVVFRLFGIKFRLFYNLFFRCQTDVKRMSNHSQSILVPISIQSTIYKCWILSILYENKSINFWYMYQLQNHTNVGYSNLIYITYENNIKVVKQPFLKNNGKSMAKQWQLLLHHNEP